MVLGNCSRFSVGVVAMNFGFAIIWVSLDLRGFLGFWVFWTFELSMLPCFVGWGAADTRGAAWASLLTGVGVIRVFGYFELVRVLAIWFWVLSFWLFRCCFFCVTWVVLLVESWLFDGFVGV